MRRKELSPDREYLIEVRVKKNSTGQYDPVRVRQYLNKAAVPPLCDGWSFAVTKLFPNGLSQNELSYLESVLANYVNERLLCTNPITWNAVLDGLEGLLTAWKHALSEINERGLGSGDPIWQRVSKELPPSGPALAGLRSLLSNLCASTQAALSKAKAQKKEGAKRDHKEPWSRLVNELADLFERKIGRATAAKNLRNLAKAKTSSFVEVVWTVMKTAVPGPLQEPTTSVYAMSNAVSGVLVRRKDGKERSTGPFQEILNEINPVNKK
jgi:hypothetical protein